ncbi:MAG: hypothetical protein Q9208_001319 [Pyrenodesmia sp. 3 TL-2023]
MRPTTTTALFVLLSSASASAFPLSNLLPRRLASDLAPFHILPRQAGAPTTDPNTPAAGADIGITGPVAATTCATEGRTVQYSAAQITTVTQFFSNYLIPLIPASDIADPAAFTAQLPTTASAGVDAPQTFALGCDPAKPMYWAPMSGDYKDDTDIVVLNLENGIRRAGFCGVLTRADKGGQKNYHICNPT